MIMLRPARRRSWLAGGRPGDITASHLAWKWDKAAGAPTCPRPSPMANTCTWSRRGLVTCLDAKAARWSGDPDARRGHGQRVAPLADGKLYVLNEEGRDDVLAAGPESKLSATNELDGSYTLSSIAVSGRQLLVRRRTSIASAANRVNGQGAPAYRRMTGFGCSGVLLAG